MGTVPLYPTFTPKEKPPASKMNQIATAGAFWARTPRCYAYDNAGFSVPNNAYTSVPLTAEVYDIVQTGDTAAHDNATNNTRVYCRTDGIYEITSACLFTLNATGLRSVRVIKNGSTATEYAFGTDSAQSANNTSIVPAAVEIPLLAGDYLEMQAFQNSGAALTLVAGQAKSFLRIKMTGS